MNTNMSLTKHLIIITIFIMTIGAAYAQASTESHREIRQLIHLYIENNITKIESTETRIQVGKIDNRLKLAKCDLPIQATATPPLSTMSSRVSVGVKCEGSKPWSLYVPTKLQRLAKVYVTSESISKGETITQNKIQLVSMDILKLRSSYFSNANELVGMAAKKNIRVGSVLGNRDIIPPTMIKKGDRVDILAKTGEIEIRMSGKALNSGAEGEQIRVTNLSSKRKLQATVIKPGLVKVSL